MKAKLVDCLYVVLGFNDDGMRITALVFEQQTCFWSIDLCRRAYMTKHENVRNGPLVFIWKVEETFVCDVDDARRDFTRGRWCPRAISVLCKAH